MNHMIIFYSSKEGKKLVNPWRIINIGNWRSTKLLQVASFLTNMGPLLVKLDNVLCKVKNVV
jgi:hypothetical protein